MVTVLDGQLMAIAADLHRLAAAIKEVLAAVIKVVLAADIVVRVVIVLAALALAVVTHQPGDQVKYQTRFNSRYVIDFRSYQLYFLQYLISKLIFTVCAKRWLPILKSSMFVDLFGFFSYG